MKKLIRKVCVMVGSIRPEVLKTSIIYRFFSLKLIAKNLQTIKGSHVRQKDAYVIQDSIHNYAYVY